MNDIEKAINLIKRHKQDYEELLSQNKNKGANTGIEEIITTYDVVIQACEKQWKKKPTEKHYEEEGEKPYIKYKCPSCDSKYQIHNFVNKHCNNCGQKIDWGDEE